MIILELSVEVRPEKMSVRLTCQGNATPLEFKYGEKIRAPIAEFMEKTMLEQGNGIDRQFNGGGHGGRL